MQIIDGYCGFNNVFADDIGQYNIAVFGGGDYVLPTGEKLGYELVSNNEIKIKDGLFITQGRRGVLKKGTTESCVIENGTQAENRNDLIVVEYAKDEATMVESHTLKVIKGTPGVAAADPTTITGNIPGGAVKHQMPLYRVRLEGLNVVGVDQLFRVSGVAPETLDTMAEIEAVTEPGMVAGAKAVKELSSNLEELNSRIADVLFHSTTGSSTTDLIPIENPEKYREIMVCVEVTSGLIVSKSVPTSVLLSKDGEYIECYYNIDAANYIKCSLINKNSGEIKAWHSVGAYTFKSKTVYGIR